MSRVLFRIALVLAIVGIAVAAEPSVDDYVKTFHPDLYAGAEKAPMTSTFNTPASNIAVEVKDYFWFATFVFLPFLILPQVLLLYVIFKFKDRKNGRKPATFIHNTRLEIAWTLIPVLALIIVGIPAFPLLYKMEQPPQGWEEHAIQITVTGKQFSWLYDYKKEGVQIGTDGVSLQQESLVLPLGRPALLSITSTDVNHAWWIPAFGVKKDAIIGRYNSVWFTPERTGFYKGQCAELCGPNHGAMIIGAVVVEPDLYATWVSFQKHRAATEKIWNAAIDPATDEAVLREAVTTYRANAGGTAAADLALRYWMAHNALSWTRRNPGGLADSEAYRSWKATGDAIPARVNKVAEILGSLARQPSPTEAVVASAQE